MNYCLFIIQRCLTNDPRGRATTLWIYKAETRTRRSIKEINICIIILAGMYLCSSDKYKGYLPTLMSPFIESVHPYHLSVLPVPSFANPLHHINQAQQHRNLNQRPHRCCKRLVTISTKRSNSDRNRKLKVIAGRCKTLRGRELISKAKAVCD